MRVYSSLLWPCSKSGRFLFDGPNHSLNGIKSLPNPPRPKQDLKNIDFSLLYLQNSLIGSLFRWFFQINKIAYKSRLDQTWFLGLNHPLNVAKSPPNPINVFEVVPRSRGLGGDLAAFRGWFWPKNHVWSNCDLYAILYIWKNDLKRLPINEF